VNSLMSLLHMIRFVNTTLQRGLPEVTPVKVHHHVGSIYVYSRGLDFRLGCALPMPTFKLCLPLYSDTSPSLHPDKLPPRFELGAVDSKSTVLTNYTIGADILVI
jgi:hypothetical protein